MNKLILIFLLLLCSFKVFSASEGLLNQGMVNPGYYEKPTWFKESFLELQVDLDDANEQGRQIILYFHQDGCPYCKKLLDDNFTHKEIVRKMNQKFDLLEINMWGDKTVTLLTGDEVSEKEFAKQMKVMFTPTLIVLNHEGEQQFRMIGYYAPDKFSAALDYVLLKSEENIAFNDYYRQQQKNVHSDSKQESTLHTEDFIDKSKDLASLIKNSNKPALVLFEQQNCSECDELHGDIFRRLPVYKQLQQFSVAQIDINSNDKITTPYGQLMTKKQFAESLNIQYTPSLLFYDNNAVSSAQRLVFRSEGYLKGFHIQALFDYILSGAYNSEPEFQRFVQRRADKMREEGIKVELWD
ncbi:MAG: thioredoxin fold domain-containing protein [gamma proteobacterium symbiont of Bathyaustriella thionipta]|nr:thioredoxin fold domain-containing protein [gamma proteobacterium symbiont of Bathyaustriella thionipta]MCU7950998.1 thioredoxin fold domain-containing protein [gamma proteobacterium symbiont of Bathyaustriella thionipta]MCU7951839.1 thioredoxin fold domain-containing protein [gamma proteobacterium symbiont of Bathyaustriella thionipta]MCU7957505.1 thioredoxin fold domain-containing protein [gamma proteobacterium symbiont of Bathyaustriella thionipta]MCU7968207.1 thioredoxin fold domain-cont